ncbi:glutaredoxin domain-containing protein [Galbibacter sp. BG1]
MNEYHIITRPGCSHCDRAKQMLDDRGIGYSVDHRATDEQRAAFKAEGYASFPQVFHGEKHVGGADDLAAYLDTMSDDF